jgi:hypothetical protein
MQLNSAPKNQTAAVNALWPEYKHITCDLCDYHVYTAPQGYPHSCPCGGGTLDVADLRP